MLQINISTSDLISGQRTSFKLALGRKIHTEYKVGFACSVNPCAVFRSRKEGKEEGRKGRKEGQRKEGGREKGK